MVITGRTRNAVVRKGSWVRIPPPPPYNGMWLSLVEHYVRDTILTNSLVLSRTPTNLLTPPLYGDFKNKIHVVKSVLTTCYPTDTGDIEK